MPPINNNFNVLVSERPFHPFTQRAAIFYTQQILGPQLSAILFILKVGGG